MNRGDCYIRDAAHLVDQVIDCAPREWSTAQINAALTGMLNCAVLSGLVYGGDWSTIWPESDAEWLTVLADHKVMFGDPIDGLTLLSVPEPDPVIDHDRARYKMLDAELGEISDQINLDQLHDLIDAVSPADQVLPHQFKWQITELAARACKLGWEAARVNFG